MSPDTESGEETSTDMGSTVDYGAATPSFACEPLPEEVPSPHVLWTAGENGKPIDGPPLLVNRGDCAWLLLHKSCCMLDRLPVPSDF